MRWKSKPITYRAKPRRTATSPIRRTNRRPYTVRLKMQELLSRPLDRRPASLGLMETPPPYSGPMEFALSGPMRAGSNQVAQVFWIRRDESLFRPYGGFRVSWQGREIGRTLSFPCYEDCRRLRRIGKLVGHQARDEATLSEEEDHEQEVA